MTECERIIKQGILPASFGEEEVQCDFLVTEKRKKLWAITIDLLFKFDEICRRHNLRYFLAYGALLGAIRHHGFIPWDDDLDVCMPREDYERLYNYKDEFDYPYFLQYPGEDNGYFFSFAKIRNSNTSGISVPFICQGFNQGIYLDIFPIDNCILQYADSNWNRINYLNMQQSTNMRRSMPYPTKHDIDRMRQYPERDFRDVLFEINAIATQYNKSNTEYGIVSTITVYKADRQIYHWNDILDTIDYDFYGHAIKIPRNYDNILRITYGDYMQMPPKDQRGIWHSDAIFEPDIPYKECIVNILQSYNNQN